MDAAKISGFRAGAKVIGIGETGLDYYYDHGTPEAQQRSLRSYRRLASVGLPFIVHTRDADDDTTMMKEEYEKVLIPASFIVSHGIQESCQNSSVLDFISRCRVSRRLSRLGHLREA